MSIEISKERLLEELRKNPGQNYGDTRPGYLELIEKIPDNLPIRRKVDRSLSDEKDWEFWRTLNEMGFNYIKIGGITGWGYETIGRNIRKLKRRKNEEKRFKT